MNTLERLKLRLGIDNNDKDNLLNELIEEGEQRLKLYLNYKEDASLKPFSSTLIKIVSLLYKQEIIRSNEAKAVKSESYSEGSVSQSVTYITSIDLQNQIVDLDNQIKKTLEEIARYRKIYAKR